MQTLTQLSLRQARNELLDHELYRSLAARQPPDANRELLERLAQHEREHFRFWVDTAGLDAGVVRLPRWRLRTLLAVSRLLGPAFTIRWLERGEERAIARYQRILGAGVLPPERAARLAEIIQDELGHEQSLEDRLSDERVRYLGSAVLGINDAVVELTGGLTGLASSIRDSKLIAFSGLVIGLAAAFSMAASSFLSVEVGGGGLRPAKAAAWTGTAYLAVVGGLVAPFLATGDRLLALGLAWAVALAIIAGFAYYSAVLGGVSFARRLRQMAALGAGVGGATYLFGRLVSRGLGVGV